MTDLPEPTSETDRLVAHRLLDLLSAWDDDTEKLAPAAQQTILRELSELGAVSLKYDDEDPKGTAVVDVTPMISATGYLLELLVLYVAHQAGQDRLSIINSIRSVIDEAGPGRGTGND